MKCNPRTAFAKYTAYAILAQVKLIYGVCTNYYKSNLPT